MSELTELNKSMDALIEEQLERFRNRDAELDISIGSPAYEDAATLAALKWGFHQKIKYALAQIFPRSSDQVHLARHGARLGLVQKQGESAAEFLARIEEQEQQPPAGGQDSDYVAWAKAVVNVAKAYCYPIARGLGTVDVVAFADAEETGDEVPSSHTGLAGTATSTIEGKLEDSAAGFVAGGVRPGDLVRNITTGDETTVKSVDTETILSLTDDIMAAGDEYELVSLCEQALENIKLYYPTGSTPDTRVFPPELEPTNVTMTVTGDVDPDKVKASVEAIMNTYIPDQALRLTRLIAIAIAEGATDTNITVPADDVVPTPGSYKTIRPGVINVTKV